MSVLVIRSTKPELGFKRSGIKRTLGADRLKVIVSGIERLREKTLEIKKLGEEELEEALLGTRRQKIEKLEDLILEAYRLG